MRSEDASGRADGLTYTYSTSKSSTEWRQLSQMLWNQLLLIKKLCILRFRVSFLNVFLGLAGESWDPRRRSNMGEVSTNESTDRGSFLYFHDTDREQRMRQWCNLVATFLFLIDSCLRSPHADTGWGLHAHCLKVSAKKILKAMK